MNLSDWFFLAAVAVWAVLWIVGKLIDRRLHNIQRQSLDITIQWAYSQGYRDAVRGLDIELGMDVTVAEFREKYGHERREVRK
jgi:hypothetical protein